MDRKLIRAWAARDGPDLHRFGVGFNRNRRVAQYFSVSKLLNNLELRIIILFEKI
jgi:hypothetical protein